MSNAELVKTACSILDTADSILRTLEMLGDDRADLRDNLIETLKQLLKDNRRLIENIDEEDKINFVKERLEKRQPQ